VGGEYYDDIFMVTLNGVPILTGSVNGAYDIVSPFPDTPPYDEVGYLVTSTTPISGSTFYNGQTAFQSFSTVINTPGAYTLEFLVADQENHVYDSGLLVDDVKITRPIVGGMTYPNDRLWLLAPWVGLAALAGLILTGAGVVIRKRVG